MTTFDVIIMRLKIRIAVKHEYYNIWSQIIYAMHFKQNSFNNNNNVIQTLQYLKCIKCPNL